MIRVSNNTDVKSLGGAIAQQLKEGDGSVVASAIGPLAVNQMMKGCAVARQFLCNEGTEMTVKPSFGTILIDGLEQSSVQLLIEHVR